ncbi:hypothetical protein TNCV_1494621 [Trichonephila clavipes]|nr:hypothetical protein TNCV_1494621 [Trichonephila clavipes]
MIRRPAIWLGALSSWKIPFPAGKEICIVEWTRSAKISLYFSPVIPYFRVTIGLAENHDMAVIIMTDPPPCLTNGKRQSRLCRTVTAGSDVVQSGRPIFDDFFQHLWPYIGNNTANVVFQMVKRLWLIRIDQ